MLTPISTQSPSNHFALKCTPTFHQGQSCHGLTTYQHNINHRTTNPGSPTENALVERTNRTIRNKLNEMINEMKISRTKAAEIIGVQERTIYRWLSGSRPIPDFVLLSLHYANLLIKNRISIDPPSDLA
jgi:DNA-binding XRE family transcriptional regulator